MTDAPWSNNSLSVLLNVLFLVIQKAGIDWCTSYNLLNGNESTPFLFTTINKLNDLFPALLMEQSWAKNQSNSSEPSQSDCCSIGLVIEHNRTGTFQRVLVKEIVSLFTKLEPNKLKWFVRLCSVERQKWYKNQWVFSLERIPSYSVDSIRSIPELLVSGRVSCIPLPLTSCFCTGVWNWTHKT